MPYSAILWDLDGTLLDTLADLAASTNFALLSNGFAPRSLEEIRSFVGNGVQSLILRALPKEDRPAFDAVLSDFRTHYAEHCNDNTRPYPGIVDALTSLRAQGISMGVVSNKPDHAAKMLCRQHFGSLIAIAIGDSPALRRKPAPDAAWRALEILDTRNAVYIGDSEVDIETAKNAGLPCISVCWGFRPETALRQAGATQIAPNIDTLMSFLKEDAT